jgi:hypothetical protein
MYRIRRLTGGEVNLASMDELAAAIAAGTVTADAEILHQRANRWLPIANHPHFRIAKDRAQSAARPAPKATPTPAPTAGAPTLRLVRTDMGAAADAAAEARPPSRWTPPQRSSAPVARPSGSAAPAMEPPSPTLEFVAEPVAPAPAAEPVRPKRVEPATAGLPMLDIEMPEPTRPMRAPTPMPAPISWPSMHTRARTESVTPKVTEPELSRAPEPVAPKPLGPEMAAPSPEPMVTVAPAPAPAVEDAESVLPTPATIAIDATPATAVMSPMPWLAPEADTALDMPPAVTDFRESTAALELAVPTELETAGVAAHSSPTTRPSRWPMYVGALAVLAVMAFLGLRARPQTETLEPKPMVATVPAATAPAIDAGTPQASARPQITPIVPAGPSNAVPEPRLEPLERDIVPAAPELIDVAPANVGSIDVQIDPNGASRQQALEETRRQIESQMKR